jgi:glycosyltransferase involved in cell wall biosynthesis
MMAAKNVIAVVIPAYKAEKSIRRVLQKIPTSVDFIVVVDDKSPDNVANEVAECEDPRVHLISNLSNRGVGGSVLIGYAYALNHGADIVVKVDSDDQMDLNYFDDLIAPVLEFRADYAKGNRFMHQEELQQMPFIRRIGNLGLSFFTKVATGYWHVFDPTNGYTAISRVALKYLDPAKISQRYFFETSMLAELRKMNAVVEDIPIPAVYNDHGSSLKVHREFFLFAYNLIKCTIDRILYQYFRFDFSATSFFLTSSFGTGLFGLVWGILKWVESSRTGVPATTGTVLIAVLPIILSVQFFVQAVALDIESQPRKSLTSSDVKKEIHTSPLIKYLDDHMIAGEMIIHD